MDGTSGSKAAIPCAGTVPEEHLELEPFWSLYRAASSFGPGGSRETAEEVTWSTSLGLRLTAGIVDGLEVGTLLPVAFERVVSVNGERAAGVGFGDLPVGMKWRFWQNDDAEIASLVGLTFPTGDASPPEGTLPTGAGVLRFETGFVASMAPAANMCFDVHVAGWRTSDSSAEEPNWGAKLQLAAGYAFGPFQPVVELRYVLAGRADPGSHLLTTTLGFTYEVGERVIVVLGAAADLAGANESAGFGTSLAVTTLF